MPPKTSREAGHLKHLKTTKLPKIARLLSKQMLSSGGKRFEQAAFISENSAISRDSAAESGAVNIKNFDMDSDLQIIITVWKTISKPTRNWSRRTRKTKPIACSVYSVYVYETHRTRQKQRFRRHHPTAFFLICPW